MNSLLEFPLEKKEIFCNKLICISFLQPNRWEVEKKSLGVTTKEPYFFPLQDNSKQAVAICPNDKFKGEPLYISQVCTLYL